MSNRSSNVKQLLRSNVRWMNAVSRSSRPSAVGRGCVAVIEYAHSPVLLDKYGSASSTGVNGTACELVRVTDQSGRVLQRFPHVLRQALLGAASARTNEKMSREFFGTLKRVGKVCVREVARPVKIAAAPVAVRVAEPTPEPKEPEVDPMDALRAEMESQDDWDVETGEERAAREKQEKKERKKRGLARWVARREAERREAREEQAATLMAAAWRGHWLRSIDVPFLALSTARLISSAQEPTAEEADEAAPLEGWLEAEATEQGMTVEELMQSQAEEDPEGDDMWDDDDRYERQWEEYRDDQRLDRGWG